MRSFLYPGTQKKRGKTGWSKRAQRGEQARRDITLGRRRKNPREFGGISEE